MTDYYHSLKQEAEQAVEFVKFGVESVFVSKKLENSSTIAYLNLCTLEKNKYCIRLTLNGYQVVSNEYDVIEENLSEKTFQCAETIDALLNTISPLFVKRFGEKLTEKLKCLE